LHEKLQEAAEMYAGCVSGAIQLDHYLEIAQNEGFINLKIHKEKAVTLPDEILRSYLNEEELEQFKTSGTGIFSITLYAEKPI
jgi:hypothetical protein